MEAFAGGLARGVARRAAAMAAEVQGLTERGNRPQEARPVKPMRVLLVLIPFLIMPNPCRAESDTPLSLTREQASAFARLRCSSINRRNPA